MSAMSNAAVSPAVMHSIPLSRRLTDTLLFFLSSIPFIDPSVKAVDAMGRETMVLNEGHH